MRLFVGRLAFAIGLAALQPAGSAIAQSMPYKLTVAAAPVALPHWFPIYIARAKFFKEEGIDIDWVGLKSGSAQVAALMGGSAQVAPMSMEHVVTSHAAGGDLVVIAALFGVHPNSLVLSPEAIAKSGITKDMPIDDKIRRLKGLRIGITGPGGAADVMIRNVMKARGINPDEALTLQPLGDPNAMLGAFERKMVDGFVMSAPIDTMAVARKTGVIAIDPFAGEVPELRGVPYSGLVTTRRQLKQNPALFAAVVRAITKAIHFVHEHPAETKTLFRQYMKDIDPAVYDAIIDKYAGGTVTSPVVSKEQFDRIVRWVNVGSSKPIMGDYKAVIDTKLAMEAESAIKGKTQR